MISNQIKSNQTKSHEIRSDEIKSNQVKSDQIKRNEMKWNQMKLNNMVSLYKALKCYNESIICSSVRLKKNAPTLPTPPPPQWINQDKSLQKSNQLKSNQMHLLCTSFLRPSRNASSSTWLCWLGPWGRITTFLSGVSGNASFIVGGTTDGGNTLMGARPGLGGFWI